MFVCLYVLWYSPKTNVIRPSVFHFYFVIFFFLCFLGLSHTPRSEKSEISFIKSDEKSYEKYVASMQKFLDLYNETIQADEMKYEDCGGKYKSIIQGWLECLSDARWRSSRHLHWCV